MSLAVNLSDLATRVATEAKALRTLLNGNSANLAALTTTAKSNLVAAINELAAEVEALGSAEGGATINDATTSGSSVWSSSKTSTEISGAVAALVASAPGTLDTLNELAAALGDDPDFATTISTALGNRVRTDTASQGLNGTQQANARTNIGAAPTTAATDTAAGLVELATNAETATGSDTGRAVTPAALRHVTGDPEANLVTVFEAGLV